MPLFSDPNSHHTLFFIHIPKTGGRAVRQSFLESKYEVTHHLFTQTLFIKNKEKEIPHLTFPHYNLLSQVKNSPKFSIVRHPLSRFISMLSENIININTIESEKDFLKTINFLQDFYSESNWFIPQHSFIEDNTQYWKFEDGINNKFIEWIKNKFGFFIEKIHMNYEYRKYDFTQKIKLSPNIKKYVKDYYKKDYEKFGY